MVKDQIIGGQRNMIHFCLEECTNTDMPIIKLLN